MVPRIEERPEIFFSLSYYFFFSEGVDSVVDGWILPWGVFRREGGGAGV